MANKPITTKSTAVSQTIRPDFRQAKAVALGRFLPAKRALLCAGRKAFAAKLLAAKALAAGALSLTLQTGLHAQQAAPQSGLDDLIPQSAEDNAEEWAADSSPDAQEAQKQEGAPQDAANQEAGLLDTGPLEPNAELDAVFAEPMFGGEDLGFGANQADSAEASFAEAEAAEQTADLEIADLELPPFERLERDDRIEFADLEVSGPSLVFSQAEFAQISEKLVLAFPQTDPPFGQRQDFVERFSALSTLRQMREEEQNFAQIAARAQVDQELLGNLLRTYGYYDGQVVRTIAEESDETGSSAASGASATSRRLARAERPAAANTGPRGQRSADLRTVRFNVIPGERYRFGNFDFGALETALDKELLRSSFALSSGDFVSGDAIVTQRYALDEALGENGYPFAEIDDPQLLVDHARVEADLTLPVRPGGKYVVGEVISDDPEFLSGTHLATIARFDEGDVIKRSEIADMRRAVVATGIVSSVTITPREVQPPQGDIPGVAALDVNLERGKLRTIAGAVGYGTEEGVRVQASWEHRNLFPPEGALSVRGVLGTQEQLGGVSFRKSNFGGRDRIFNVDAYASRIDSPAFDARTIALETSYERLSTFLFQKKSSWSAGLELIASSERPPEVDNLTQPRETFYIAAVPLFAQYDTSDDLLDPTEGMRLSGQLSPEISRSDGRNSTYLRARFDLSTYNRVSERVVLAARVAFGAIPGTDLNRIAPSRRLYAGGGGSVRGYGYREIGPRDDAGEPSGGRSLVEGAVEARIGTGLLDGAISVVPFVDAGSVSSAIRPDFAEIKVGAGLGLRYNSGFGSLRLDVGVPLNPDPGDNPVAVYVSLGQAF